MQKDVQVASLEEMELTFTEPSEEVTRTMVRLYAVPSEKLRVWMVWLTNVAEIADEWHKWLRAHIDLIARIAERLQMAANRVPGGRKIESTTLKMPKNEAEMIELRKNFTHQVTLYRSYYKHWKETADQRGVAKREKAKQLVVDTVRADEDIPYFFYLRVEPDIDIAIRYNDEKAILSDPDRESISANRKYLYFNLTDEPEAKQLRL